MMNINLDISVVFPYALYSNLPLDICYYMSIHL